MRSAAGCSITRAAHLHIYNSIGAYRYVEGHAFMRYVIGSRVSVSPVGGLQVREEARAFLFCSSRIGVVECVDRT